MLLSFFFKFILFCYRKFLRNYLGNKSVELLDRFFDYICYYNHPLAVVIFYLYFLFIFLRYFIFLLLLVDLFSM